MGCCSDNRNRKCDKSALVKTFGIFLLSIMFLVTYIGDYSICTGDTWQDLYGDVSSPDADSFFDYTNSECRMNLYDIFVTSANTNPADGHVKLWYYILIWLVVMILSVLGFIFLLCNCCHFLTRVYAFGLFGAAVCLGLAEFVSIFTNYAHFKDSDTLGDNWQSWSAAFNGLNSCVAIMEVFILLNVSFDAWCAEYKDEPAKEAAGGDIDV